MYGMGGYRIFFICCKNCLISRDIADCRRVIQLQQLLSPKHYQQVSAELCRILELLVLNFELSSTANRCENTYRQAERKLSQKTNAVLTLIQSTTPRAFIIEPRNNIIIKEIHFNFGLKIIPRVATLVQHRWIRLT